MALPLYVAAAVMVVGGLLAIYFGSDIIVMERGWTMVIAGSVFAGCGALLAGIATVVARLHALETEFARSGERPRRPDDAAARTADFASELVAAGERTTPAGPSRGDLVAHRDLEIAPEPVLAAVSPRAAAPTPSARPERAPAPAPAPEPVVAEPFEPDLTVPDGETAAEPAAAGPARESSAPTVVGTYNSGGNYYTMYSDGSIEAETPAGKFRFDSLDELKDFIARGGDKKVAPA
jgi:hypothetical protein